MAKPRQRLKILYVGTLPPHQGGSAILGAQLLVGLAKLGHAVRALAPITAEALQSGDPFACSHPAVSVVRLLVPHVDVSSNLPHPDDYQGLEREQVREILPVLIVREPPDLIMIGRESFAWNVPDLARIDSIPCILLVQGGTILQSLLRSFPEARAQQLLEQFRKATRIVTVAHHLEEALRPLGLNNIRIIPNPVDLHLFSPKPKDDALMRELAIAADNIVVVHVSNLKPLKRPMDLIGSAESALQENPKLVYLIVGDGPSRTIMEETCKRNHTSENFRFVGWVDHSRVPDYINLADLVVMPSQAEGLPQVYLEAQACARLLLASDIPAAREVIVDEETGLLFKMADIDDLTAKTLRAAGDPELRAAIGRKARQRVMAHDINKALAAHEAALEDLVQAHRERSSPGGGNRRAIHGGGAACWEAERGSIR